MDAPTIEAAKLIEQLQSSLGREKAEAVVLAACRRMQLDVRALSHDQASALLDEIGKEGGLVGVVARFSKARLPFMFGERHQAPGRPSLRATSTTSTKSSAATVSHDVIVKLFADGASRAEAAAVVSDAVDALDVREDRYDEPTAMRILDRVASRSSRWKTDAVLVRMRLRAEHFRR